MSNEKDIEIYNKIDTLCKRIEAYTTKAISVNSEIKNTIYVEKIQKIIEMIDYETGMKGYYLEEQDKLGATKQEIIDELQESESTNKYNPSSEDFCFKDKLQKNNGDVNALIEELKAEDKLGYRNAYIINQIKKFINMDSYKKNEVLKNTPIPAEQKRKSSEIVNLIKNIISKIRRVFKGGNANKI